MELVYDLLVVLHLVGMAIIVGGWIAVVRAPKLLPGMWHGALTQLVTGIALVGLWESDVAGPNVDPNHAKLGVKLLVALAIAVLVFLNRKKGDAVAAGTVHAIGGLALLNVLVAVLWPT